VFLLDRCWSRRLFERKKHYERRYREGEND
jgi:hypothetical protein